MSVAALVLIPPPGADTAPSARGGPLTQGRSPTLWRPGRVSCRGQAAWSGRCERELHRLSQLLDRNLLRFCRDLLPACCILSQ